MRTRPKGAPHGPKKAICYTTRILRLPSGWYQWRLLDPLSGHMAAQGRERRQELARTMASTVREQLHEELAESYARPQAELAAKPKRNGAQWGGRTGEDCEL